MGKFIPNGFNMGVVIFVALGSVACSYGMSIISSTIGQPNFYIYFNLAVEGEPGYSHTSELIGAMNGLSSVGSMIGCGITSWIADSLGRKRNIQLGAVMLIVGAALCAAAVNMVMFLIARLIAGLGIGMLVTGIPMYQAEVSTPESRGLMVSMHGVMFAVGYSLSAWVGFSTYFVKGATSFSWRFPLAFQAAPAILLLIGSPWLPFSPRWLLQQDRHDEALATIQRLHRSKDDPNDMRSNREFYQMKRQLGLDRALLQGASKWQLFATTANRKRALLGFLLMFGNQFTGILIIANYGILLYGSLGMSGSMPLLLSAIWVTASFPGNVFNGLYVDRFGRRTFLLTGLGLLVVVLIFECAMQAQFLGTTNVAGQRAAIFFIFLFIICWSFCVDASQFLYLSEIFPTHVRAQGMAVGMSGLYCATIILLIAGPTALNNITWKFFLVLIIPTAAQFLMIFFFAPETKQMSLEDINVVFGDQVAVHYYHATAEDEKQYDEAIGWIVSQEQTSGTKASSEVAVQMVEMTHDSPDLKLSE